MMFYSVKFLNAIKKVGNGVRRKLPRGRHITGVTLVGALGYFGLVNSEAQDVTETEDNETLDIKTAVKKARDVCQSFLSITNAPGLSIAVSIDGRLVYKEGFGFCDLENAVACSPDTLMRIASISKPITMAAVAKLWETGKLDIDKPVKHYVSAFPEKYWNNEKVDITTRQIVSHLGGIRHYEKQLQTDEEKSKQRKDGKPINFSVSEYYIKEKYESVEKSLEIFKNDPLMFKPGTHFLYTTHGWTLVSAVVEAVVKEDFSAYMKKFFNTLGLHNTYLDENEPVIVNRSRYYIKDKKGHVVNAPYVDNSYKWAGGGFLSTASDVVKFSNAMLYSYQYKDKNVDANPGQKPGFLKSDTIKVLWTRVPDTKMPWNEDAGYGMGWEVTPETINYPYCKETHYSVQHTGAAIGASSAVYIIPRNNIISEKLPQGVVVAILVNMQGQSIFRVAKKIAEIFECVAST